jgi:hypothetical protein
VWVFAVNAKQCSGHGACVEADGLPGCRCDPGYESVGLGCVPSDCSLTDCSGHGACVPPPGTHRGLIASAALSCGVDANLQHANGLGLIPPFLALSNERDTECLAVLTDGKLTIHPHPDESRVLAVLRHHLVDPVVGREARNDVAAFGNIWRLAGTDRHAVVDELLPSTRIFSETRGGGSAAKSTRGLHCRSVCDQRLRWQTTWPNSWMT